MVGVQGPLCDLGSSVGPFVEEFNRNKDRPRLVVLVSPTCPECLAGALAARRVLTQSTGRALLLLVWMKGLPEDEWQRAEGQAREFRGDRIRQFWDGRDLLGAQVATRLNRAGLVVWDIYLGFRPGLVWDEQMPQPAGWVHQMGEAPWAGDPDHAVAHELEARIRRVLDAAETDPGE